MLLESLALESLTLGKHVAELTVGHLLAQKLAEAISSMRAVHNSDLEHAIVVAFENATRTQEKDARTRDEKLIWQQLHNSSSTLFTVDSEGFPFAVIEALVIGDENSLRKALATVIDRYSRDISPDLRDGFQKRLPRTFLLEFGEVLKQEKHERAWNAFLREILRKTYQKLELPCCVLPFLVSVWYPQALSHTLT